MSTAAVRENLEALTRRMADLARQSGRDPGAVRLVAVSKTKPAELVLAAHAAGQRAFGENRVQELATKAVVCPPDIEWHLIGHLQRNKVRQAVRHAAWIHSVDTVDLLDRLDRIAGEEGRHPMILLQVNVSGEVSKEGVAPDAVAELLARVRSARHLTCRGLMTIAPFGVDAAAVRGVFRALRNVRDRLAVSTGMALPELSMGMSGDYADAIAEGATMVRIGTAVFGAR